MRFKWHEAVRGTLEIDAQLNVRSDAV